MNRVFLYVVVFKEILLFLFQILKMTFSLPLSRKWTNSILPYHSLPPSLHPWQVDAIESIVGGENVGLFVPTGSGKTLPQLVSCLFFGDGVGMIIPPLLTIEFQIEAVCRQWNIPCLNLSSVGTADIMSTLKSSNVKMVIASIECISDIAVQKAIRELKVNYVSIDECQVMDENSGWASFRPYVPSTWNFLRANFRVPFLLCSATMDEESMNRIVTSLSLNRSDIKILFKSPDRSNIYQQLRVMSDSLDVGNIQKALRFMLPVVVDSSFSKCQIFCVSKRLNDIAAAWLKEQLGKLGILKMNPTFVEKLSGDNSREEKFRVLELFKEGGCKVLVSTDVAGMGTDVAGLSLIVNLGIPKSPWKFLQQCGRAGREGQPSVAVTVKFPMKGRSAPVPSLKAALGGLECLRKGVNSLFHLTANTDYTIHQDTMDCLQVACEFTDNCECSACNCCSSCRLQCACPFSEKDQDTVVKDILDLGDARYVKILEECKERQESSEDEDSDEGSGEIDEVDSEDDCRVDELELSLVDLTPQLTSLCSIVSE